MLVSNGYINKKHSGALIHKNQKGKSNKAPLEIIKLLVQVHFKLHPNSKVNVWYTGIISIDHQ